MINMNKNISVIYKIIYKGTDKLYIGSAINFRTRVNQHKYDLKRNKHHSKHLQRIVNKHGIDTLDFDIVEIVEDKKRLIEREQYYIDLLKPQLNSCPTAGNCLGRKMSDTTKESLIKANIGKVPWNKGKNGPPPPNKGKKASPEVREKLRVSHLGQNKGGTLTQATKVKISEARKKQIPPSLGKRFTDDHKEKISESHKGKLNPMFGKSPSAETLAKISLSRKINNKIRKPISEETREKLRKSHLGKSGYWTGKKQSIESVAKQLATKRLNKVKT